ncbi:hypothetical protein J6590_084138 [Homalodisca vitripennis]|nr:hypothetical protein J6590_084138 [Homalodisca vitripennis]
MIRQREDSCRDVFRTLQILPLTAIYICEVVAFSTALNLPRNSNVHQHNTRNRDNFNLPVHRTSRFSKKPSCAGSRLFNLLPVDLKCGNPKTLKRSLQKWMLEDPVYSIEEFVARCDRRPTS